MKKASLILCAIAVMGAVSCNNAATTDSAATTETAAAATEGKIVYVDLDRILMDYDMANAVGPRFPGPLLIRTRCPDTSPNSTL